MLQHGSHPWVSNQAVPGSWTDLLPGQDPYDAQITPWQWLLAMVGGFMIAKIHAMAFGPLSTADKDGLQESLSRALGQIAVAMVCFREPIGWKTSFAIIPSLVLKWFHRLTSGRLAAGGPRRKRLMSLIALLFICDMVWMHYWSVRIFTQQGLSPLTVALLADLFIQWGDLLLVTSRYMWSPRVNYAYHMLLRVYMSIVKLFVYFAMALLLLSKWHMPAHIARDAYAALRGTVREIRLAVAYRRASQAFGLQYASPMDLQESEMKICPICYDSMELIPSVKTTCGHCMHLSCIYSWFQLNPVCPICRTPQGPPQDNGKQSPPRRSGRARSNVSDTTHPRTYTRGHPQVHPSVSAVPNLI